jgi:hypothetical protein
MLHSLDLTSNSLFGELLLRVISNGFSPSHFPPADLPILLQSLRGCYRLKHLAISGNPVTQEKSFCAYLLKAVPSLEVVEERGVGVQSKCNIRRTSSSGDVMKVLSASNIYMTCRRQIEEQDTLRAVHCQRLK